MGVSCTRAPYCNRSSCSSPRVVEQSINVDGITGSTSSLEVPGLDVETCNTCFEPVGAQTSEHWAYVGPGRGGYDKMPRSSSGGTDCVGTNTEESTQHNCNVYRCCCISLVFCVGLAFLFVLRDPIAQVMTNTWASPVASGIAAASNFGQHVAEALSRGSFLEPVSWAILGEHRFNCSGDSPDRGKWPLAQRRWCCKTRFADCNAGVKAKSRLPMLSTSRWSDSAPSVKAERFDCKSQWSPEFKDWCCSHQGVEDCHHGGDSLPAVPALSAGPPPPRPAEQAAGSAAEAGAAGKGQEWPVPRDTSKVTLEGCDTLCEHHGQVSTCRFRIQWAATHDFLWRPSACRQGHKAVLRECPHCSSCSLAKSSCVTPAPTTKKPPTTASVGGAAGAGPP